MPDGPVRSHEDIVFSAVAEAGARASPGTAPPLIGESWRRCVSDYRLDPARRGQPRILTDSELRDQRAPIDAFARLAREKIDELFGQVADAGLVVLLTNANGVTVEYRGHRSIEDELKSAGLYLGSVWAEEVEGTNGVGTCLATGRPLTIFREEHFRTRNIGLTCTVAPIRDPFGQPLAVLDVSSMSATTRESQHLALQLVRAAAAQLERGHIQQQFARHWKLRLQARQPSGGTADMLLVLDDEGCVIGADSVAFEAGLMPQGQRLLGATLDRLFSDLPELDTVLRAAHTGQPCTGCLRVDGTSVGLRLRAPEGHGRLPQRKPSEGRGPPKAGERPKAPGPLHLDALAGEDPGLQEQTARLKRVLDWDIPVLLQGETGTGKEAFARALHTASARASGAFVAVNCAAIPEPLIESELFGYCGGAFTGARRQGMTGRVTEADGGTLFLDEIGDMPLELQARLLRVLAEREVVPLGSGQPRPVDIRLVCASNQDLAARLGEGRFREDLYYRIRGFVVTLPPLRARCDKARLLQELLAREAAATGVHAGLTREALAVLSAHTWPGNIREARDALRIALALADGPEIGSEDLPPTLTQGAGTAPAPAPGDGGRLRAETRAALDAEGWCVARAARRLGVSRATMHRRIKSHGLVAPHKQAHTHG